MNLRSRIVIATLALALSACGLSEVDAGAPTPETSGPMADLDAAIAEAPFPIRLPSLAGFTLSNVDFISEPEDPAGHGYSLDVRYTGPDGAMVHVFQTNVSPEAMGSTDPVLLLGGEEVLIAGDVWTGVTLPNGDGTFNTQLARRFDDVTLSLDAPSPELAHSTAASLEAVDEPD